MFKSDDYDVRYLKRCLCWLIGMTVLMYVSKGSGFVIAVPFMFGAVLQNKAEDTFFWLLLTVAMLTGNANLMPKGIVFSVTQRFMMVALGGIMMTKVFGGRKSPILVPFYFMIVYVLYMVFPSAVGWSPVVSFLKLFLFSAIFFAYLGIAKTTGESKSVRIARIRGAVLAFSIFFLLGSVLLIPFPAISQIDPSRLIGNTGAISLFTGMTMHSQCLGPVVASLSVILFADLIFSIKKFDKLYCILLLCCPILIYKTSSRTGMGTYLFCMIYVIYLFMRARGVGSRWRSRVMSLCMGILALLSFIVLATPSVRTGINKYIIKGSDGKQEIQFDTVVSSRQSLIDSALYNFHKKPMTGNGFQVSEDMAGVARDSLASILSAPIEKGVWIYAVLEEGGIIGMSIFCFILLLCIFIPIKHSAYITSACVLVIVMSNLGEFTFFSMSYTGGIIWAMVFAGAVLDMKRIDMKKNLPFTYYGPYN